MNWTGLMLGEAWPVALLIYAAVANRRALSRWLRRERLPGR